MSDIRTVNKLYAKSITSLNAAIENIVPIASKDSIEKIQGSMISIITGIFYDIMNLLDIPPQSEDSKTINISNTDDVPLICEIANALNTSKTLSAEEYNKIRKDLRGVLQ